MRRLAISAVALVGLVVLAVGAPAGALSKAQLKAKALSVSDMPTGWAVTNPGSNSAGCFEPVFRGPNLTIAKVHYADSGNVPTMDEEMVTSKSVTKAFATNVKRLNACHTAKVTVQGHTVTYSIGQLAYPKVGNQSVAYNVSFSAEGINGSTDVVIWRDGSIIGAVAVGDYGSVDIDMLKSFVTEAANKIEGKAVTPPSDS